MASFRFFKKAPKGRETFFAPPGTNWAQIDLFARCLTLNIAFEGPAIQINKSMVSKCYFASKYKGHISYLYICFGQR